MTNGSLAFDRPLLGAAGLVGALGVATAAAASHLGKPELTIARNFALFHAPALLALSLIGRSRLALVAGWVLTAGLLMFAGDLAARGLGGTALFPMAAPLGGIGLIAGWLLVVATAVFAAR
jgi:uncharacterized membrane protein YgdD (TMEM256/DUF423 family)